MKKIFLSMATATLLTFNFSGCANNGLAVGTVGKQEVVVKEFKRGYIISTKKVLVSKSMTAVLTGASVGATAGAVGGGIKEKAVAGAMVGGVVGAVAGGAIGFVSGLIKDNNEVEAYQTVIRSDKKNYTAYLEKDLPKNTKLEFVIRENEKITNVNLI